MDSLYLLKKNLDECGVFLSFSGPISQNLMVELGDILKKQMEMADAETSTILKVFAVLVEQSQNIIRYSAETLPEQSNSEEKLMFGTIAVGYKNGKYFVLGGNKIKKEQIKDLKERLILLQKMTKDELKEYYRTQRKKESREAGLGLIDLSRKASEPVKFHFEPIDSEFSFFSLRTLI
ncbi:SiaB family protein kinase [bacterium]|nr:SiaB family protein kinase [bacterium]